MRLCSTVVSASLLFATGCHSAYIETTLRNATGHAITLVELDYPSASFGTQSLAPNQDFHYRFKILGSGDLKLTYTDFNNQDRKANGPALHEGDEGTLLITVTPSGAQWTSSFHHR